MVVRDLSSTPATSSQIIPDIPFSLNDMIPFVAIGIIILIILYLLYRFLKTKLEPDRQFMEEAFKQNLRELQKYRINKGIGKLIALIAFLMLGFGLGKWLFPQDLAGLTIVVGMSYLTGQLLVTYLGHWIVKENKVITPNLQVFGILESLPMRQENDFEYYLVRRGTRYIFFPQYCILKLPVGKVFSYKKYDSKLKRFKMVKKDFKYDLENNFRRNDNYDLIVNAVGFEKHGHYYYPVYREKSGDLFSFKDIAFGSSYKKAEELALYDIGQEQLKNAITMLSANPYLGFNRRTQDKTAEISGGEDNGQEN